MKVVSKSGPGPCIVMACLSLALVFGPSSFANPCNKGLGHPNNGKNFILDLSSSQNSIRLARQFFRHMQSVTIDVGGNLMSFQPKDKVTPAEFVAIRQILSGGSQTIDLDSQGGAVGGFFNLPQVSTPGHIASLVIPANVTALDPVTKPHLNITNVINVDGLFLGLPGTPGRALFIRTGAIDVGLNGAITTDPTLAPPDVQSVIGSVTTPLNLTLVTQCFCTNSGSITSSGTLLIKSFGGLNNFATGLISSVAGTTLQPTHGVMTNNGIISSTQGSVVFTTVPGRDLVIDNTGGQILSNVAINFREPRFSASSLTQITNGLLSGLNGSPTIVNFFGGNGPVIAHVDQVNGTVNGTVGSADISVLTGTLGVGSIEASRGGITLTAGNATSSANIAINAANSSNQILLTERTGDITITAFGTSPDGNVTIGDSAKLEADGGNIIILAANNVQGGTGDSFTAHAAGKSTSFTGGGIQIGAGLTSSTELSSLEQSRPDHFTLIPDPLPSIGAAVDNHGIDKGVVKVSLAGTGTIQLNSGGTLSQINTFGGVVLLQSVGSPSSVTMNGATFNAFEPVSYVTEEASSQNELLVDTADVELEDEDAVLASSRQ